MPNAKKKPAKKAPAKKAVPAKKDEKGKKPPFPPKKGGKY